MKKLVFLIIAAVILLGVFMLWPRGMKAEVYGHNITVGLYDQRAQICNLLTRTLEFIEPDTELDKVIYRISEGSVIYPKQAIERYIRMRELRQEIEQLIKVLE